MALKTIEEAIACGLCSGALGHVQNNLRSELRNYIAHRVMLLPNNSSAMDLFVDIFKDSDAENAKAINLNSFEGVLDFLNQIKRAKE